MNVSERGVLFSERKNTSVKHMERNIKRRQRVNKI